MKLVTTFHPSSSVLSSFKARLSVNDEREFLVIAKLSRVEVHAIGSAGLEYVCGVDVWGKVLSVVSVPTHRGSFESSDILVMTDHPDPELIFLTLKNSQLQVKKQIQLYERSPRPMEYLNTVLVDSTGSLAIACCYMGKLKIIQLDNDNSESYDEFDVNIQELNILALTLLQDRTLAILHVDYQQRIQLLTRDIDVEAFELSPAPSDLIPKTIVPSKWIAVPGSDTDALPHLIPIQPSSDEEDEDDGDPGGVIILGGKKVLYYACATPDAQFKEKDRRARLKSKKESKDSTTSTKAKEKEKEREAKRRKAKFKIDWPWADVQTWCEVMKGGRRFLMGDAFGRLVMLSLDWIGERGMVLLTLGETSPATTLTYLDNQVIYVGSHLGPPQLVKISPTPINDEIIPLPDGIPSITAEQLSNSSIDKGKQREDNLEDELSLDTGTIVVPTGSHLTIISTFKNIAPIMDAILVDPDASGQQKQIVVCSGGRGGRLNVLRSGTDFREMAKLSGLENVVRVWCVRARREDVFDTHLVVSTLQDTLIFKMLDRKTISYVDPSSGTLGRGFVTDVPTMAMSGSPLWMFDSRHDVQAYVESGSLVQVTRKGVEVLRWDDTMEEFVRTGGKSMWADGEVMAACVTPSQVVMGVKGQRLVVLSLEPDGGFKKVERNIKRAQVHQNEVSSVSAHLLQGKEKKFATVFAVAYWGTNDVEIFKAIKGDAGMDLVCVHRTAPLASLPREVMLWDFSRPGTVAAAAEKGLEPSLVVGLTDGSVLIWRVDGKAIKRVSDTAQGQLRLLAHDASGSVLTDRRTVASLGHAPVSLASCVLADGQSAVFACASRAALLTWDGKRVRTAQVLVKCAVTATNIHSEAYPASVVMVTGMGLSIGRIQDPDKMHIREVDMGRESPRKICHDPESRTFAVACARTTPYRAGDEPSVPTYALKLLDDTTYRELARYDVSMEEEITAVACLPLSVAGINDSGVKVEDHESSTGIQDRPHFICVGTMMYKEGELEPSSGYVRMFQVNRTGEGKSMLSMVAQLKVKGCVYAMAMVKGMLAVTVNSSVMILRLVRIDSGKRGYTLFIEAERNHNYFATTLVSADDDTLILGDRISSVSALKVVQAQEGRPSGVMARQRSKAAGKKKEIDENGMDVDDGEEEEEVHELTMKFELVARDYGPLWPNALDALEGVAGGVIGADFSLNLFSFVMDRTGRAPMLEKNGNYHIADFITKFCRGGLVSSSSELPSTSSSAALLQVTNVFFTSSGRIGVVIDIKDEQLALQLTGLERNLAIVEQAGVAGGVSHARFRAPRMRMGGQAKEEPSSGFLDGDYLEQFLALTPADMDAVVRGRNEGEALSVDVEEIRKVLEMMPALH